MDLRSHYFPQSVLYNIRMFLARGGNPNHRDQFQDTLLHLVAKMPNSFEIVEELVRAGADVNLENFLRQTPLHIAVLHRNFIGVNALIHFGALINSQDCRGNSILHSAINACASMDKNWNCENPHCSHRAPDMRIILALLQNDGIDVNIKNFKGCTPLLWAVKNQSLCIVKELLKRSALVNIGNYSNETPLNVALSNLKENLDIARELLSREASFPYFDINDHIPVDLILKWKADAES